MSMVAENVGVDIWKLLDCVNLHPRVNVLQPGPGVGGHCIAVDPMFIAYSSPEITDVIQSARRVNKSKPRWVVDKVKAAVDTLDKPITIACLGLSFKPNVNDFRNSPALEVAITIKQELSCHLVVVEPNFNDLEIEIQTELEQRNLQQAICEADIIVALVAHDEFMSNSIETPDTKTIIDTCGLFKNRAA